MFQPEKKCGPLNFIDLFAGAGGLSEGFFQAGFNPIAHVEMNEYAAKTLETRTVYYYLKKENRLDRYYAYLSGRITREELLQDVPEEVLKTVMCKTMSDQTLPEIFKKIDEILEEDQIKEVDVIIGGPPCQAYSLVGRAQSSHMDVPMEQDPRNRLYILYTRFLTKYRPKMFVFENVMGIETANKGQTWRNLKQYLKRVGYEIECREQNSSSFGVLQNRRRMIIIGWRKGSGLHYPQFNAVAVNAVVNDLLQDLPKLTPGRVGRRYGHTPMSEYVRNNNLRTP